ncbi:NB-ARC domain disease resistance protein [Carex littledalei]|uniref:NB-ARC domain disease resistance protein n=1 Tax=Carex littledalei TaxID=544730 RepID=A0A833R4Q9_9POAL|nr:NB-ARC domain disease resistance protein [Carex littledalei]
MLDLRYTNVKEIPENYLGKLGKLQHLLLGYIKEGENQLAGTKLNVRKLTTNLKTLRAIEQPEVIDDIRRVSNVVDLSVTGLTMERQQTFWATLDEFEKLSSLGVAVTHRSDIRLQDCGVKLKKNLKRLRMEGLHSGLEKLGEFENLIDLTLASHKPIDINSIPRLPNLLCLRLYGVCEETILEIGLQGFDRLMKLVIGDMGKVERVQIGCAVIGTVATLKLSNLQLLKEVVYLKQDSNKKHSLLRWGNSKAEGCSRKVKLDQTIFLRRLNGVPVDNSPCLTIYNYDM